MVRVAGTGDRLVPEMRHTAESVRVAVVRGDPVISDPTPRQIHAGSPLLQVSLSQGASAGVGQVPGGDAEVRTLLLEVPAHGGLVVLAALEKLALVMAAGPQLEGRVRPGEG